MRKRFKFLSIILVTLVCVIAVSSIAAFASVEEDNINKTIPIWVQTDIGAQVFAANVTYKLQETYTTLTNAIRFTQHYTFLLIKQWSGSAFCSLKMLAPSVVKFYDSSNTFIKQANLWHDDSPFISDGSWYAFTRYICTDIATINTIPAYARCTFTIYPDDSLSGFQNTEASVTCY